MTPFTVACHQLFALRDVGVTSRHRAALRGRLSPVRQFSRGSLCSFFLLDSTAEPRLSPLVGCFALPLSSSRPGYSITAAMVKTSPVKYDLQNQQLTHLRAK